MKRLLEYKTPSIFFYVKIAYSNYKGKQKKVVAKYYIWSSKVQIIKDQMLDMTHIFEDKKKLYSSQ